MIDGQTMGRGLALPEMRAALQRAGWTGDDLKGYTERMVTENFSALDDFSGGALSEIPDPSMKRMLAELTAWRMAMEQTGARGFDTSVQKCRHGYVGACGQCQDEEVA